MADVSSSLLSLSSLAALAGVPLLAVQPGPQLYTHTPSAEMPLEIDSCLSKPAVHTCL